MTSGRKESRSPILVSGLLQRYPVVSRHRMFHKTQNWLGPARDPTGEILWLGAVLHHQNRRYEEKRTSSNSDIIVRRIPRGIFKFSILNDYDLQNCGCCAVGPLYQSAHHCDYHVFCQYHPNICLPPGYSFLSKQITYSLTGHDLNIAIIFTSLQFFNVSIQPL